MPRLLKFSNFILYLEYGYGFLSVFIISVSASIGLVIVPFLQKAETDNKYKRLYAYVMSVAIGLAVGTLTGDALLHLLPSVYVTHQLILLQ